MRIDAHQHFWHFDPVRDAWITEDMKRIRRDFLPSDLAGILKENQIDGSVAVQADQSEEETRFLIALARHNDFIKGVVAWVDLRAANVAERLEYFSQEKIVKGFRHVVQGEPEDDFILRKDFCHGIGLLSKHNFTYDILIYPRHLTFAIKFVQQFPDQKFVIDHLAKPPIKTKQLDDWTRNMRRISACKNVHCKLSGLLTEADWSSWSYHDIVRVIDVVVESFGTNRIMYGSDWPVCLLAAPYNDQLMTYQRYFRDFSEHEKECVFGNTAREFYNLL
jgi:L-fuconolactonase